MTQTLALLLDAYRELNSKKLFWITMILSMVTVSIYAMFGLNERGITFLWWTFDLPVLNTGTIPAEKFYKFLFANIGIPIWLTWAAAILALISTASIIPDFIAGGAVELTLSKPIGRARLFLTKFFTGLLFVALQVSAFTFACFLVIGIRGGSWELRLFLAVPIVLLFFSYLYSICALLGLLTRSTIASLLITLLAWILFWGVNVTDGVFMQQRERTRLEYEAAVKRVDRAETAARRMIQQASDRGEPIPGTQGELPEGAADDLEAAHGLLKGLRAARDKNEKSSRNWARWSGYVVAVKTVMPKTSDTIGLLNRYLLSEEDMRLFSNMDGDRRRGAADDDHVDFSDPALIRSVEQKKRARSVGWIVGTSVLFEGVVLLIAVTVFVRRDF